MIIQVRKAVRVSIEPSAAVSLQEALKTLGETIEGLVDLNCKLLKIEAVEKHGEIELSSDFRANGVRWICPVVYRFSAITFPVGNVYLFAARPTEARATFENAHCSGLMMDDALASNYSPGDIVPMVIQQSYAIRGQSQFSATVHPWTVGDARAPLFCGGPVSSVEVEAFPALADKLEETLAQADDKKSRTRAKELMGIAGPPPPGALEIVAALREMHAAAGEERPLERLSACPGSGYFRREAASAADATAVERPAVALATLAHRELALLNVLDELTALHGERMQKKVQDRVWQMAAQTSAKAHGI